MPTAVGLGDLGRPAGFLARAVSGWRKRGAGRAGGRHRGAACRSGSLAGAASGARRSAGAAAQRLQAEQHDPRPARPVAGRGGGLGPGHARRSAVRFRHAAQLLGARGRSAGAARHGADAGGRGRFLAARAGGGELRRAERARHVRLPVPPRAGDVQAGRDLPAARLRWRSGATTEPRYAGLTAIGTGIVEFAHEIAQGRAF